jgi:hypothetical protein
MVVRAAEMPDADEAVTGVPADEVETGGGANRENLP